MDSTNKDGGPHPKFDMNLQLTNHESGRIVFTNPSHLSPSPVGPKFDLKSNQTSLQLYFVDLTGNTNSASRPKHPTSTNTIASSKHDFLERPSNSHKIGLSSRASPTYKNGGDHHYYGRMHSLTKEKYGPYTCPKCDKVFITSQNFASHARAYYRRESSPEKRRRFDAIYKKRSKKCIATLNRFNKLSNIPNHPLRAFSLDAIRDQEPMVPGCYKIGSGPGKGENAHGSKRIVKEITGRQYRSKVESERYNRRQV